MSDHDLATAHRDWDDRWADQGERAAWERPEPAVERTLPLLRRRGVERTLDVGCGVGRHAVHLAACGLASSGIDASPAGLAAARAAARAAGVAVDLRRGPFVELPYDDASFGYVLAWNVIYHGDRRVVAAALAEIARVLVPGGVFQGTMLSKRNRYHGRGVQIRPDTYVVEGDPGDKAHPHFYCDARGLLELCGRFELLELRDREQAEPGSWHWEYVFERRDG